MRRVKLTGKRLREVLNYDLATGVFTWAVARSGRHKAAIGERAGSVTALGYRKIWVDQIQYQASHLAWFWVHGAWPTKRNLRFKDGIRDNCAIDNLGFGDDPATYRKKYRAANPNYDHGRRIKFNYGVTLEQYRQMLLAQKGVCACCGRPETATQRGRIMTLCVDHDHKDGSIRGLLCQHCNKMLGHAKDSTETLTRAVAYLDAHAAKRAQTNVVPLRAVEKGA